MKNVEIIKNWLLQQDIVLSGRYSEWEYYNSDHAFLAGRKAADLIKALQPREKRYIAKPETNCFHLTLVNMIVDAHIHCSGDEKADDILNALDEAGVDKAILLAPFLSGSYSLHDRDSLRLANRYLAKLVSGHEDRLVGFAVVNPSFESAPGDLRHAHDLGLHGLKMVPTGWYPYDDCAHRVYEVASSLKIPVLFHSGIFIDGKSGRYCRPSFFEAIRDHAGLRVTLAHLGWPWCDEANAVGLIDLINGVRPDNSQFRFDISFGAPPVYRLEVLRKAIAVLTPELLQFGSDVFLPCSGELIRSRLDEVSDLLSHLELDKQGCERIMGGTAAAWLGVK